MVTEAVKKWTETALSELSRGKYPFPVELILSHIQSESGGKVGTVNKKSGASGLMQVMPVVVKDYNRVHKTSYTIDDMRTENGMLQIRVGIWILGQFWRSAYKYLIGHRDNVPLDELAKIASLFYVAGPGATRKKMDKLASVDFESVASAYPTWVAIAYARKIWRLTTEQHPVWNLGAIDKWVGKKPPVDPDIPDKPPDQTAPITGFLMGALIIVAAWIFLQRR